MKASKDEADYHPVSRRGDERCGLCSMYRAPFSCTAVEGKISPKGVCAYFKRKRVKETA